MTEQLLLVAALWDLKYWSSVQMHQGFTFPLVVEA